MYHGATNIMRRQIGKDKSKTRTACVKRGETRTNGRPPLSFFWTRSEGPRTGSRQDTIALLWAETVTVFASMTTEQNHRRTQEEASHRNEVTTSGDLVDVELPVEAWPPVQPSCILYTHTRRMRHILGCGCTRRIHRTGRLRRMWWGSRILGISLS